MTIRDRDLLETRAYFAGRWHRNGASFAVTNPASGATLANVSVCSPADIARAVEAAKQAQGAWAACLATDRSAVLRRVC